MLANLPFVTFFASFDSFQVTEDDQSTGEEHPDSQDLEEQPQQEEVEEEKVSEYGGEEGRLYVGNLPYSMTSSELSEIFSEVGRVANVEVCVFFLLFPILFWLSFFFWVIFGYGFFLLNCV